MEKITIYHNPKCSKSRQTLALLNENGVEPEIIEYLQNPPDKDTLSKILEKLGMKPREAMRSEEEDYKKLGLAEETELNNLIKAMVDHPILIERPIVVKGDKACICRPPEKVLKLLTLNETDKLS